MIEILKQYKGSIIGFYLKGNKSYFTGVVRKIEDNILCIDAWKKPAFVKVDDIQYITISNDKIENHVIPNAFS